MNDNPFASAVAKLELHKTEDEKAAEELDDLLKADDVDFDEAQELSSIFSTPTPHTVRNYAKDRTLSGKDRKRARRAKKES